MQPVSFVGPLLSGFLLRCHAWTSDPYEFIPPIASDSKLANTTAF